MQKCILTMNGYNELLRLAYTPHRYGGQVILDGSRLCRSGFLYRESRPQKGPKPANRAGWILQTHILSITLADRPPGVPKPGKVEAEKYP
jgi:hypothetical protein